MNQINTILIPLIRREIPALLDALENMPRPRPLPTRIVLSIDDAWTEVEQQTIKAIFLANIRISADSILDFLSCEIPPAESVYHRKAIPDFDPVRLPFGLKSGPNMQFFRSIRSIIASAKSTAVLLLETDAIPLHEHWLESLEQEVAELDQYHVAGARYSGITELPETIADHVNGNAVYNTSGSGFVEFLQVWEEILRLCIPKDPSLAYDVVLDWAMFYKNGLRHPGMDYLASIYESHIHHICGILNIAGPAENSPDFIFDPVAYAARLVNVNVLHCKPALPYRDRLISLRSWAIAAVRKKSVFGYDAEWQYPAITERHAFSRAQDLLTTSGANANYVGFPWATLIDFLFHKPEAEESKRLMTVLKDLSQTVVRKKVMITVCQHIFMLEFQELFHDLGITDVFWSHAVKGQDRMPKYPHINIHPFPLYPVQTPDSPDSLDGQKRDLLYSFVGAKAKYVGANAKGVYLSESRNIILRLLGDSPDGIVVSREGWHYERSVYGDQIGIVAGGEERPRENAEDEFKNLLRRSTFSLCPSGTGPNSIRLWESIAFGTIPVILAETQQLPGDLALWDEAVVFCAENEEAIAALPTRLRVIAADPAMLARKRHALRQLWMLYSPEFFIYDIQRLFVAAGFESLVGTALPVSYESLNRLADLICRESCVSAVEYRPFLLGCGTRAMTDPQAFQHVCHTNDAIYSALMLAMKHGEAKHTKLMRKILVHKCIDISVVQC